jgi:rhodanese-related sulfurtransferase
MTTTISAAELRELMASGEAPSLLDVRTTGEFDSVHIPGAFNVPLDQLPQFRGEIATIPSNMVLVCQSGNRAGKACTELLGAGMANVRVLEGGMQAWEAAGGTVARGKQRWQLERQVRLVAGLIVLAAIVVSIWVPWVRFIAGGIGLGLTVAALTNTCAMGAMLAKLPYNRAVPACDTATTVAGLRQRELV